MNELVKVPAFAAIMLLVVGVFHLVNGINMLDTYSDFENVLLYSNLDFWGWTALIVGALQIVAGLLLYNERGQLLGLGLASLSIVFWVCLVFAAPFAALMAIGLNVLVILDITGSSALDEVA